MLPDNHTSSTRNSEVAQHVGRSPQIPLTKCFAYHCCFPTQYTSCMRRTHLQLPTNILLLRLMRWRRRCRPAFLRCSAPFCCCCCFCQAAALRCMLRQLL